MPGCSFRERRTDGRSDGVRSGSGGVRFVHSQFSFVSSRILRRKKAWLAGQLNIKDNDGFKALYGSHWWHFIGPALREVILPEDDYKIRVNGELVWDDLGSWEYSQDVLNFSGSLDDKMMQSQFHVLLAVGKLLFGRHATAEAMNFASGMVGAIREGPAKSECPAELQLTLNLA